MIITLYTLYYDVNSELNKLDIWNSEYSFIPETDWQKRFLSDRYDLSTTTLSSSKQQ